MDSGGRFVVVEYGHHTGEPYQFGGSWASREQAQEYADRLTGEVKQAGLRTRYEVIPCSDPATSNHPHRPDPRR